MDSAFSSFFQIAMGNKIDPYPYQIHLAEGPWPDIVKIETGMGKTAGIILGWLYKRLQRDKHTPRRLVYCLPMRVLVEQTADNARTWVDNLVSANVISKNERPAISVLMGGEIDKDWDRYPEQEAILIGTQDQLLSHALNRGYATSRFRWPIQFGLLNNDCIWVMDEVQLMGAGLATTTQMQAFRNTLGTVYPVYSIWMSATLDKNWLNTVDSESENLNEHTLSVEDLENKSVDRLLGAKKILQKAEVSADNVKKIAETILTAHKKGTLTLVVVNTVKRATDIYKAVKKKKPEAALALIHSRFRPSDREKALEKLITPPGKEGSICISTQVVEAGVDVSATTLITDLAPWASMVQRFGRCNRYGQDDNARVIWLDINLKKKGAALPYSEDELYLAASILSDLTGAGLHNLPDVSMKAEYLHVLRRKDIVDLFDTTPDLSGMDIDISRYIRETDDHGVHVFWRDIPKGNRPEKGEPSPSRDELCSAPIGDVRERDAWRWDHLEKRWERPVSISPGMTLLLRACDGGYSPEMGWTKNSNDIPELPEPMKAPEEANDDDYYTMSVWQTLADHTDAVVIELDAILSECNQVDEAWKEHLILAARWHDSGKAHEVFQNAMVGDPPEADTEIVWAKTERGSVAYQRKGFRHELASALAMIENGLPDLAAYLAAAHHGKVRLSIRSLPSEKSPGDPTKRFARGIWEGDVLREADLGDGHTLSSTALDLSFMEFGDGPKGPSWLSRMLSLRDDFSLGPFRLAFFEALIRAADWRASDKAGRSDE